MLTNSGAQQWDEDIRFDGAMCLDQFGGVMAAAWHGRSQGRHCGAGAQRVQFGVLNRRDVLAKPPSKLQVFSCWSVAADIVCAVGDTRQTYFFLCLFAHPRVPGRCIIFFSLLDAADPSSCLVCLWRPRPFVRKPQPCALLVGLGIHIPAPSPNYPHKFVSLTHLVAILSSFVAFTTP